ncbi:hypothetical protein BAUCODRAFT_36214 [Baudoinia panamericana UAMH 10762]|uniref:Uncharacterized protein n=1 Tax=Baudoinia panamericana (strain UAMH 10762) TaxID=717646 RepID=M2MQJ6_BAUPA|nr:uncharacterized protein BAUCODRAFT_36214 [Baudoinia panamericana UAMH 10762]EMC93763.1 hypothetical protein BAUCODRAFT_36214 [Baudoinia panamericana UAMH 10762]
MLTKGRSSHNGLRQVTSRSAHPSLRHSLLLALPEKVRRTVYTYVVTYEEPIPIRLFSATSSEGIDTCTAILKRTWFFSPPVLRICRAIAEEAAPPFYANNSFKAEVMGSDTSVLQEWLNATHPAHLALIPELIISLEPRSFFDLQELRADSAATGSSSSAGELAALLVGSGISGERVFMKVSIDFGVLREDAMWLGRRTGDVTNLWKAWFADLQECMDREEYGMAEKEGTLVQGEGTVESESLIDKVSSLTSKMAGLLGCAEGRYQ